MCSCREGGLLLRMGILTNDNGAFWIPVVGLAHVQDVRNNTASAGVLKRRTIAEQMLGCYMEVRGPPERDILSLRAFGPGGRTVLGIIRVSARVFFVDF